MNNYPDLAEQEEKNRTLKDLEDRGMIVYIPMVRTGLSGELITLREFIEGRRAGNIVFEMSSKQQ